MNPLSPLPKVLALVLQAFKFLPPHVLLAPTLLVAAIYLLALSIGSLGAGIIALKHQRLVPMVLSHLIINFAFTLPALLISSPLGV